MRFFLVGRHRESGDVRIVSERTFATRQEALDSLSTVERTDAAFDDSDLFVVDLEAVTPVVVYRPTAHIAPAAPSEEPIADAWVAPVEEPVDEALSAGLLEPVDEVTDDLAVVRAGDDGLAEALRRAASRMEAEGIQPAATIEEVIAAQTTDAEATVVEPAAEPAPDDALADELEALAGVAAVGMSEPLAEEPDDEQAASWPWEPSAESAAPVVVEPASELYRPSGIEEPAAVASDMLPSPADDFIPRPVIMGDYPERDDFVTVEEADAPAAEPEPIDVTLTSLDPVTASDADVPAYQPASIDMGSYTCEDCVYAGTCPKAGQDRPATCGSFQWKSM
jgi:hypothetical protein